MHGIGFAAFGGRWMRSITSGAPVGPGTGRSSWVTSVAGTGGRGALSMASRRRGTPSSPSVSHRMAVIGDPSMTAATSGSIWNAAATDGPPLRRCRFAGCVSIDVGVLADEPEEGRAGRDGGVVVALVVHRQ